jgi:hypothetical protein
VWGQVFDFVEHFVGQARVLLHDVPLLLVQSARLEEDTIWDTYLAYVVQ